MVFLELNFTAPIKVEKFSAFFIILCQELEALYLSQTVYTISRQTSNKISAVLSSFILSMDKVRKQVFFCFNEHNSFPSGRKEWKILWFLFPAHVSYLQNYFSPSYSTQENLWEKLTAAHLGNENSPHFTQLEGPSVAVFN